jgi:hypothetical protein
MRLQRTVPAILAAAVFLPACSGDSGPTAIEIPLARVEITQGCGSIGEGSTCVMEARGFTAEGQMVTNAVLRWSSNATSVAQVSSEGRVFGVGAGRATITVEAAFGEGEDSIEILVFPCTKCD